MRTSASVRWHPCVREILAVRVQGLQHCMRLAGEKGHSRRAWAPGGMLQHPKDRGDDVQTRSIALWVPQPPLTASASQAGGMYPELWIRVGLTVGGARVYYGLAIHVFMLTGARIRHVWRSLHMCGAAAEVWRVDITVGQLRPTPVRVCEWVPRPLGPAGGVTLWQATYRAGFCFDSLVHRIRGEPH